MKRAPQRYLPTSTPSLSIASFARSNFWSSHLLLSLNFFLPFLHRSSSNTKKNSLWLTAYFLALKHLLKLFIFRFILQFTCLRKRKRKSNILSLSEFNSVKLTKSKLVTNYISSRAIILWLLISFNIWHWCWNLNLKKESVCDQNIQQNHYQLRVVLSF